MTVIISVLVIARDAVADARAIAVADVLDVKEGVSAHAQQIVPMTAPEHVLGNARKRVLEPVLQHVLMIVVVDVIQHVQRIVPTTAQQLPRLHHVAYYVLENAWGALEPVLQHVLMIVVVNVRLPVKILARIYVHLVKERVKRAVVGPIR